MPKAFNIRSMTHVWIDPANGWLVVDAAVGAKVDAVMGELFKAIDGLAVTHLRVQNSPVAAMTDWLATDEAPAGFTIDQDTVLQSSGESRASIRIANQSPEAEDVARHIAAGKRCTRLAMTWNDRVSFVLTESLAIKRVVPLDVLKETASTGEKGADEAFDGDFLLMAGELAGMLSDLVYELGGEQVPEAPDDFVSAAEDAESPDQGEADPLYPQAVGIVQKNKRASISLVQRHLRIGYNRAARLLEQMEGASVVSPMSSDGNRRVLAGAPA
jgi:recombination associated protein RdgC